MEGLRNNPNSRRLILTTWNPYDMAHITDINVNKNTPSVCHSVMVQFFVRNQTLHMTSYQRSADMFLGVPFNIASYALLTIILARVTGNEPGEFIHTFGDVHIYENHLDQVKEQLTREPKPFPEITLAPELRTLSDFKPELITLNNYDAHPVLKATLSVSGGLFEKNV
jgi:thymidylate synthase